MVICIALGFIILEIGLARSKYIPLIYLKNIDLFLIAKITYWLVIKAILGLRPKQEVEELGVGKSKLSLNAYPDFDRGI